MVISVAVLWAAIIAGALGWWLGVRSTTLNGPDVKGWHEEALEKAPDSAMVLISFDVGWVLEQTIHENWGLLPTTTDPDDIHEALSKISKRGYGVDILEAERGVIWVAPTEQAIAMYLEGDFDGDLKGEDSDKVAGVEIVEVEDHTWAAVTGDGLVIGNKDGVTLAVRLFEGKEDPLSEGGDAETHTRALDAIDDGSLVISFHLGDFSDLAPREYRGIEGGAMAVSTRGDMTAAVIGKERTLKRLVDLYEDARDAAETMLDDLIDRADEDDMTGLELVLTLSKMKLDDLYGAVEVEVDDDLMLLEGRGQGGLFALYAVGAGAVALPAYLKYMARSKTVEAIDQLDRIYKSSSLYYTTPRVSRTGERIECQFPASQGMTPDINGLNCCGGIHDRDRDDRCDVNTALWATPTWSALNFQMNDQHYFGYRYESAGVGTAAKFSASAFADLDCDGTLSTFERYGYGDSVGSYGDCQMKGSSAFYKNLETE